MATARHSSWPTKFRTSIFSSWTCFLTSFSTQADLGLSSSACSLGLWAPWTKALSHSAFCLQHLLQYPVLANNTWLQSGCDFFGPDFFFYLMMIMTWIIPVWFSTDHGKQSVVDLWHWEGQALKREVNVENHVFWVSTGLTSMRSVGFGTHCRSVACLYAWMNWCSAAIDTWAISTAVSLTVRENT